MKFFQETTVWESKTPNHIYLMNDNKDRIFAYVPAGTTAVKEFKTPIRINTRGRKFKEVKNTFKYSIKAEEPSNPTWKVTGSKGDIYTVELQGKMYTCTCSGFTFRGNCKHVKEISDKFKV